MNEHLSRLELALSERYSECSIVAAEAAKTAEQRVIDDGARATIFLISETTDPAKAEVYFTPVSQQITLTDGRKITLGLHKSYTDRDSEQVTLSAVTRGDVALPLAQFARRQHSVFCDYVQIGQEMDDESFVVTQENEMPRREIIELLRDIIDVPPEALQGDKDYSHRKSLVFGDNSKFRDVDAIRLSDTLRKQNVAIHYIHDLPQQHRIDFSFTGEDVEALAIYNVLWPNQTTPGWVSDHINDSLNDSPFWVKRHLKKCQKILEDFMENPSLARLDKGDLPGSQHPEIQKYLREAVIRILTDQATPYDDEKIRRLLETLDAGQKFDHILGDTTPVQEDIFSKLGRFTLEGPSVELSGTIKDLPFARTVGDIALRATIKRRSPTASVISISARPEAIEGEYEHVYDYILDRVSNNADLTDVEAKELDTILNQLN